MYRTRRLVIFITCSLIYFFAVFHRVSISVLIDHLSAQYGVDKADMSSFSAVYFWFYALLQPVGGSLADVIDPSWLLTASGVITALGSLMMGITHSFGVALVGRALIGIGLAPVYIPSARLLISWYSASDYAFMSALLLFCGGMGAVGAAYPLRVAADALGVPATMGICSAITLALGAVALFFVRADPSACGGADGTQEKPIPSEAIEDGSESCSLDDGLTAHAPEQRQSVIPRVFRTSPTGHTMSPAAAAHTVVSNARLVLTTPCFYLISIWGFFTCGGYFTVTGLWAMEFVKIGADISSDSASMVSMVLGFVFAFGSPAIATVSNKLHTRKWIMVTGSAIALVVDGVFTASAIALVVDGVFTARPDGWSLASVTVALGVWAMATNTMVTIAYTSVKERFPIELSGAAMSWVNLVIFLGSAILQQITKGTVLPCDGDDYCPDSFSWGLWGMIGAGQLIALGCILCWPETFGQTASLSSDKKAEGEGEVVEGETVV
ncbi:major facilitator superfamily protein [Kipferlia bialata]|uniref:Lysosomal dipeptide transporter MFSD1 n=1 Tax=Kipferlia bialata TaxID=797122 RepID=A0A9K3CQ38_9EUKA|nr:major facilitator superfamily protein [Kipferlia bialata]|eukprot:g1009.t1